MAALLVPVGHSVGPLFVANGEQAPDSYDIRFGDGIFSIDAEELRIWSLAHGNPRRIVEEPPSRDSVIAGASDMPAAHVLQVIDRLRDVGLLAEFEPRTTDARDFSYRHQVEPLALGLGNTVESPWYFQIGLPQAPRVIVSYDVYYLWMFSHRHNSLWDTVRYVAEDRRQSLPPGSNVEVDPDRILASFIEALPAMVSTSSVYVDRVR